MKTHRMWFAASLLFVGSAVAHAGVRVPTFLADITVPEPSSAMVGAGALLIVLGVARRFRAK
jgi:hypothetical protein